MKFRKRPVVIDAEMFDRDKVHSLSPEFRAAVCDCERVVGSGENPWHIHTLEGRHVVSDLDWIIKGVAGEFYPCKPDIFAATYERA
jgi:hypothetical protein